MGFFKDFKRDFAQAVNELMPDKDELANEYDDEDIVNTFDSTDDMDIAPEDMLENIDDISIDTFSKEEAEEIKDNEPLEEPEKDENGAEPYDGIPEAEIVKDEADAADDEVNTFADELGEAGQEEILEAIPPEELQAETEGESVSDEADYQETVEAYGDDELKAVDALDEEKMMENTEDALLVEPEANVLEGMDLNAAVETAISSRNENEEEKTEQYEEADMADIEEKIIEEETTEQKEQEANSILTDDTTYITKGTTIKGNIETEGGIDVIGTVEGDVKCSGKLIIGGTIEGNIEAGEIYANAAKLKGEIVTEGSVKIGVGTVVVGNVTATSAVIAGAVNGDIDVQGPVIVDSTAVIMGDIKSRSVQINNGAVIEGRCSQCYSEIDVKSFFE